MEWISIDNFLKRLKKKIWRGILFNNLINLIFICGIFSIIIILFSHFKSLLYLKEKIFYSYIIVLIFMIIKTILSKPSMKFVALQGDKLGLKEKLITYVELREDHNDFIDGTLNIFKEDLEDELQTFNVVKRYKYNINYRMILLSIIFLIISFGLYFIPSTSREEALELENINKNIKKEIVNIDKMKKDVLQEIKDDKEKKQTKDVFAKLKKELKKTYNYDKALAEMGKAEERLNSILKHNNKEKFKKMAGIFNGTSIKNSDFVMDLQRGEMNENNINSNNKISQVDKNKIKKNLYKNKMGLSNEVKEKIENQLMKKNATTKELAEAMKNANNDFEKNSKIAESKSKLLAKKEQKAFENGEGDKKSDDFALGGKESKYKYGEESNIKNNEDMVTGNGNSKREDNNSLGSSKTLENKEIKENANKGSIGKYNKSTDLKESKTLSNVNSKINSTGKIFDKSLEEIIGEKGEVKYMKKRWEEFKKEGMDYLFKYNIPLNKEDLVIEYFKELNK
ncbi:hypothetical protein [Clostridium rectalis]|uniref:hypothetical protein n=1 Tax=Clostridium rectalis TaxID=2040295 RepID=UPI0013DDFDC1|nr:hypothetical protein [Clostridium rectalis]